MQGGPRFFTKEGDYPNTNFTGGDYAFGIPMVPSSVATLARENQAVPPRLNRIEFEPSEICPQNFIIFDQTDYRSKVMFHPALAHKFGCPSVNIRAAHVCDGGKSTGKLKENEGGLSSSFKEDTADIDALLSSDDDDEDDDVVSTGRTPGIWGDGSSNSSFSAEGSDSREMKFTSRGSFLSGGDSSRSERKREQVRKMVSALRGIIPGGESMDTHAILDEAVKYLKSLKVEAKKLGIRYLKD